MSIEMKNDKIIHIRQKVKDLLYDQFETKFIVEDYDRLKTWDQMDILKLEGEF